MPFESPLRRINRGVILALVLPLWVPTVSHAIGEAESEDGCYAIEVTGSERLLGGYLHFRAWPDPIDQSDDGFAASVTRLMADGEMGEDWRFEINSFVDLTRTPSFGLQSAFATAGSFRTPYRTPYLDWSFWEDGTVQGTLGLDRFNLRFMADPVEITVGRFPVNHSVTYIFTPNDFFVPFDATSINKIYKPGVDAVRVGLATGMLSTVELLGVLGYGADDQPSWGKSAVVLRANTVLWRYDWAILGGKLAERWFVGASFQGEAGPFGLRGEAHVGFPDRDGDGDLDTEGPSGTVYDKAHVRFSVGFDIPFEWHSSSIGAEYAFLSDGASPSSYMSRAAVFFPDDQIYLGGHYAGMSLGTEVIPILRTHVAVLLNAVDHSGLGVLSWVYSIADEAEFTGGVMIPWGEKPEAGVTPKEPRLSLNSEFGAMPAVIFLETRFYF